MKCLKLKQQVPSLNLNCDDLIQKKGVSLIEVENDESSSFMKEDKDENNNEENETIKKIEKLEKVIENIDENVRIVRDEIKSLKNSFKKNKQQETILQMKTFNDLNLDLNTLKGNKNSNFDLNDIINGKKEEKTEFREIPIEKKV